MSYGYNGKILRVDLTSGTVRVEEPGEIVYRTYLGGGGLASYYLLRELKPGIDPLSTDNILIFASSVISGVPIAGMVRYHRRGQVAPDGGIRRGGGRRFLGSGIEIRRV